eukprot:CAMPEP_0174698764 /NCGR_PEP_ID=MMETSP1094-20130205/4271_1 /TAXON_ID=156173 /ORGANISM="Chrysochromulina brevifilum, Strain UTEX LB 985" /LENGTH=50 /DNA_ID=CAMNT_0015895993 /DNA_START=348 /DNA_END=497 /DNA_ORIENTATION=+
MSGAPDGLREVGREPLRGRSAESQLDRGEQPERRGEVLVPERVTGEPLST